MMLLSMQVKESYKLKLKHAMTLASNLGRGPAKELPHPERQAQHASEQDAFDRMLYTFTNVYPSESVTSQFLCFNKREVF